MACGVSGQALAYPSREAQHPAGRKEPEVQAEGPALATAKSEAGLGREAGRPHAAQVLALPRAGTRGW